jgi:hypothetical protein
MWRKREDDVIKSNVAVLKYIVQCYGYLITSDQQLYNVTPLKTPVRLLIGLFTIFTFVLQSLIPLLHVYIGWLLSYQLLSQIITHFTSSHFETLAEILLREFTS